jgi:outer membrane protein TolC
MTQRIAIGIVSALLLESAIALLPGRVIAEPSKDRSQPQVDLSVPLFPNASSSNLPKTVQELELPPQQGISLRQALELATRYRRDLEQGRLSLQKSQAALREQKASLSPTLSATAQSSYDRNNLSDPETDSVVLSAGVQANYTVFDFGQRNANINIQNVQVRTSELEVNRLTQEARQTVAGQYYDLQNSEEQVRIYEAAVANSQRSLQDTQLREQAGLGTRFDTLQAQSTLANDRVNLLQAQSNLKIAQRKLAQELGLSQTAQLAATDPIQIVGSWSLSLEQTLLQAFAQRVELDQKRLAQQTGQFKVKLAKSQTLPQVKLSAGYTLQESPLTNSAYSNPLQDNLSVSLNLNWSLFDGGVAKAQVDQAKADTAIGVSGFADQRDQIRLGVETAFFTIQSQRLQIDQSQVGLTSAQEQLRLARLRFDAGVGTQLDILNAQSKLTQAQSNLSSSVTGYNKAFAQLQRAVNRL